MRDKSSFLGTRARVVEFVARGMNPVLKNFMTLAISSFPTVGQASLKNLEVRPSGPGALFGLSFINTDLISS